MRFLADFESYPQIGLSNYRIFNTGNYRIYKESRERLCVKSGAIMRKMAKIAGAMMRG